MFWQSIRKRGWFIEVYGFFDFLYYGSIPLCVVAFLGVYIYLFTNNDGLIMCMLWLCFASLVLRRDVGERREDERWVKQRVWVMYEQRGSMAMSEPLFV